MCTGSTHRCRSMSRLAAIHLLSNGQVFARMARISSVDKRVVGLLDSSLATEAERGSVVASGTQIPPAVSVQPAGSAAAEDANDPVIAANCETFPGALLQSPSVCVLQENGALHLVSVAPAEPAPVLDEQSPSSLFFPTFLADPAASQPTPAAPPAPTTPRSNR